MLLTTLSRWAADPLANWLPTGLVVLIAALSLTVAGAPPVRRWARGLWVAALFVCGTLAVAGTVWQAQDMSHRRPEAMATPPAGTAALATPARAIAPDTATKLAAYLKKSGSRAVVVSVIPGDVEAYDYANRLANLLRAAGWQAEGPETTRVFGDLRAVGVTLFANPHQASDAAKILADAFGRFNIPYEPRVTPDGVVPDSDAVELFVGALPGTRIASESPPGPDVAAGPPINPAAVGPGSGSTEDKAGEPQ